jgi:predicted RNA binding protein YcfA (HicA-like mRNA interferase family)
VVDVRSEGGVWKISTEAEELGAGGAGGQRERAGGPEGVEGFLQGLTAEERCGAGPEAGGLWVGSLEEGAGEGEEGARSFGAKVTLPTLRMTGGGRLATLRMTIARHGRGLGQWAMRSAAVLRLRPTGICRSGPLLSQRGVSVAAFGAAITPAKKTLEAARAGSGNIRFRAMVSLLESLGFRLARVSGSHHIFVHPSVPELVNLQDVNGKCKPYQVRQVLALVERYNLTLGRVP